jgi:Zn-dependent protease with chaperone function
VAAAPFLVRRFVEPQAAPRTLLWIYGALMVTAGLGILGLSVFFVFFLAPNVLMRDLGVGCAHGAYCVHGLPLWAQFTLWISVTLLAGWIVGRALWTAACALRASRKVRRAALACGQMIEVDPSIPSLSRYPVCEVPDPGVFACTVGIRRPLILVSAGLRDHLSARELAAVVAHEQGHAGSWDNLTLLVARMTDKALPFFPGVAEAHAAIRRLAEMAADAFASREVGDSLLVASSLARFAGLVFESRHPRFLRSQPVAAAFGQGELVADRVERLVTGQQGGFSRRRLLGAAVALILVLGILGTSFQVVTTSNLVGGGGSSICADLSSD